jgi:YggT family protein
VEYFVRVVIVLCYVLIVAIIIRSLLSWFPVNRDNFLVNLVQTITEPILAPLRRIIPRLDMIDFSPMVAIILLYVITWVLEPYAG